MSLSLKFGRVVPIVAAIVLGLSTSGCLTTTRTQGYELSEDALAQVRVGQSKALVETVLGSPQSTGTLGNESVYYYVQTRVEQTAFGLTNVKDRIVLAVYFDRNNRVSNVTRYGLEDGRIINFDTRRTPSYGQDRSFIEALFASI